MRRSTLGLAVFCLTFAPGSSDAQTPEPSPPAQAPSPVPPQQVPETLPPQQAPTPQLPPAEPQIPVTPEYPPPVTPRWPPPYTPVSPVMYPRPKRYEPWKNPRAVRGTVGFAGFGTLVVGQRGGAEVLDHGSGFSIWGGVDLGRVIGFAAKYSASFHNPFDRCYRDFYGYLYCDTSYLLIQSVGINMLVHIPTTTRVMPFVEVGPLVAWMSREYYGSATGGGFEAGGGIDFWLTPHLTLGFEALYRGLLLGDYAHFPGTDQYLSLVQLGATLIVHLP